LTVTVTGTASLRPVTSDAYIASSLAPAALKVPAVVARSRYENS
jgi:hypothetical protein